MKKLNILVLTVLVLMLALPLTAFSGGFADGRVVLGGEFVLETGDTLDGDLAIVGGIATLMADSEVTGSVFLVGGNLVVDGKISGDLAVVGGNARLGPAAVVGGDLLTFGGNVNRNGGTIMGDTISGEELNFPLSTQFTRDLPFRYFNTGIGTNFVVRTLTFLIQSFMLAALAVLIVMFLPKNVDMVASTIVSQPVISGAFGLLTFIVAPILIVFLIITICLAIVGIAGVVVLIAAGVLGWIALGLEVGKRLGKAMNQDYQPVVAAGLGTLIFALVVNGIGFIIPCVGWLAPFLASAVGLGAVLMTRFGTRAYGIQVAEVPPTDKPSKPAPKKRSSSTKSSK